MRAVVVVVAVSSSVAAADPRGYVAKPLVTGQWVEYRERVGGHEVGTVSFLVGNRAACGQYFEATLAGPQVKHEWIFCVDDDHRIVEATLDDKPVAVKDHAAELDVLLTRVLPPQFVGAFVTEDVTVPAGKFYAALRKDGATTTWLHPAVPLGGVVRVQQGDREDVLVAVADAAPAKLPAIIPASHGARGIRRPSSAFVDFGYGVSALSGVGTGRSSRLELVRGTLGFVAGARTDIVAAYAIGDTSVGETDPAMATKAITLGAGARLWPLGRTRAPRGYFDPRSLFVQLTGGYARLENVGTVGNGGGASATGGWSFQLMHDWSYSLQVFDDAAYDDRNVGFRNTVGFAGALELWLP